MAWTGTQRWRNPAPEGDDVQRSIELLDKVLSEYDEHETEGEGDGGGSVGGGGGSGNGGGDGDGTNGDGGGGVGSGDGGGGIGDCGSSTEPSIGLTPDDESPSLGHQSEDDGYMSMNGRKAKMALLALRPVPDCPEPQDLAGMAAQEFPPPPEEAERIISTLLPMVSPSNSSKRSSHTSDRRNGRQQWSVLATSEDGARHRRSAVTTQTTLPKTRHRRPYGWENGNVDPPTRATTRAASPPSKFASLPYDGKVSFGWIPPRTNPCAVEKHREVRRRSVEDDDDDGDDDEEEEEEEEDEAEREDELERRGRVMVGDIEEASSPEKLVRGCSHPRQKQRQKQRQMEMTKSSSVEDRLLMNHGRCSRQDSRRRNDSDSSEGRFSRNSESERSSIPRSSSVSVERFSIRATCDSSDFSRANSTSNERFHSDFSIAVASASSNDRVSIPSSDPFSLRNLDFVSFSLPRADSAERFSGRTSDRCSEERYSDMFSTRNSDFSTRNSTDFRTQSEEERFSDDSLEELLPPPPPIGKRHSIAWEVPLEDDPLYAPGSTKVVGGRRRRKSSDVSSVGSASKLRDFDDWQDPRLSTTDDDLVSPYSDSSTNDLDQIRPRELTKNGTYVIRRGRKKERKLLPKTPTKTKSLSFENGEERGRLSDAVKRYSNTFDDIRSLLSEGDNSNDATRRELSTQHADPGTEFVRAVPPDLIRITTLPGIDDQAIDRGAPEVLAMTVEEEEEEEESGVRQSNESASRLKTEESRSDRRERLKDSDGILPLSLSPAAASKVLDAKPSTVNIVTSEEPLLSKESSVSDAGTGHDRSTVSKIPVNLLIEDQIVKKALKENRRQLERVSDAIKEIESARNSERRSSEGKRWRNGEAKQPASDKRNSFLSESESSESRQILHDDGLVDARSRKQRGSDSETSRAGSDVDSDRRKPNGTDVVCSSSRRSRQNGIENHRKDQKQIENVIDAILEDSKNPDFQVSVEVLEFPPLPPSPVEEADEESSDIGQTSVTKPKPKTAGNRTMEYRPRVPPHRGSASGNTNGMSTCVSTSGTTGDPAEHQTSLNTRSMDAGFARGRRAAPVTTNSRREVPVERRTLPTDLPGPSRRRPLTKRHSPSGEPGFSGNGNGGSGGNGVGTGTGNATTGGNSGIVVSGSSGMQTSCSLPETPVFARGSDIPRTPQHAGNPTQTRRQPGWYAPTTATTGYRRNNPGLEQAIIGTELLRLAGGPNRGWYPTRKANQPRPASIEHLERLNNAYDARLPATGDQRKPLTLPTNITPNKYFGQSKHSSASSTREALRRVTSLLIKKGSGSKEGKGVKDNGSPSGPYAAAECGDAPKKKGFFKGFWKRSRHYSLENQ